MIQNYSDLITEVGRLLARRNLLPLIPGWIQEAESRVVQKVRSIRETIYIDSTGTLTEDVTSLTLPEGVSHVLAIQLHDEVPKRNLTSVELSQLLIRRAQADSLSREFPEFYTFVGERTVELAPTPLGNTPYTIWYTGMLPIINDARYKSQVLIEAPNVLKYGAALEGANHTRNWELADRYEARFERDVKAYGMYLSRAQPSIQVGSWGNAGDRPQTTGGTL